MDKVEKSKELFKEGYNCAQAVVVAFEEELGLSREVLSKMMSSFGGGLGRQREVCGAVSGMCFVAGVLLGYSDPKAQKEKSDHYNTVQTLCGEFKGINGSIICRELLSGVPHTDGGAPEARTTEYYKKRPCAEYVAEATRIMADFLAKSDIK
ncbi:MAG: C-GCAxxG-C-C family protein [Bacillota bacterium]